MFTTNSLRQSEQLYKEFLKVIPNGSNTLSKCPNRFVNGVYPKFIRRAEGCVVEDVDRNLYTDYICGLGPILLGYNNRYINNAVKNQLSDGTLFSLSSPKEMSLAETLSNIIPSAKKIKFFKTGSEATSAAVKVARAYTKKDKILVCGYHGWHDWYSIVNDKKAGIPRCLESLVHKFTYNDLDSLRQYFDSDDIAAIIMEPVVYEEPKNNFLQEVLQIAHAHGALVIFDEIVTGFRFGLSGYQGRFNVVPDLSCFSKAMGNGFPIAALVGFPDYMNVYERDDFFVSGTFGGDLIGIVAALAVVDCLEWHNGITVDKIWASGKRLKDGFNDICKTYDLESIKCEGYPVRTMFTFPSIEHKAFFWQECVKQGILFGYANFISSAHTPLVIENTLNGCEGALRALKEVWSDPKSRLEGDVPVEVFRLK